MKVLSCECVPQDFLVRLEIKGLTLVPRAQHWGVPGQKPILCFPRAENRERLSLGMSKRMSERISFSQLTNEKLVREKFSTNDELHNLMKMADISWDVSKDIL